MSKNILIISIGCTLLLLAGFILNVQIILLAAVGIIAASIFVSDVKIATELLFYFTPLSYIMVFNQYNIYILPAAAYIAAVILKRKITPGFIFAPFLMVYCVVFADYAAPMKMGQLIYPILLMLIWFVCRAAEKKDYPNLVTCFAAGFIVSAVIGFFKEQIPAMQKIFVTDSLFINKVEMSGNITRYSGLSYDPNFFALVDSVLIAILLLGNGKKSALKTLALIFLTVVGFYTFSKSYVVLLVLTLIAYIFKGSKYPKGSLFAVFAAFLCMALADHFSGVGVLKLINARFTAADNMNDLTTGRADLWIKYLDYILSNAKCLILGRGFNTFSLGKAVHNTYIDWLYRFGIIGSALWMIYFRFCKREILKKSPEKLSSVIPAVIFLTGIFFLSAFYFQQFWCCIFLVMLCPYMNGEENNEETERDSSGV